MSELAVRGRPFPPGTSGNPNGRPPGHHTRHAFSEAFMRDLAISWGQDGATVLREARVFVDNHSGLAAYISGRVLFEGIGVEANPAAGVDLLRSAARQQVGESMELLARAYGEGRGIEKNPIEALAYE